MLIKLGIGIAAGVVVYVAYKKVSDGLDKLGGGLGDAVDTVLGAPAAGLEAAKKGIQSIGDIIDGAGESITQGRDDAWNYVTSQIPDAIKPTSDQNLIYKGVNAVGGAVTGDTSGNWSLGSWLYDVTHPTQAPQPKSPYWKS